MVSRKQGKKMSRGVGMDGTGNPGPIMVSEEDRITIRKEPNV